ncbi:acetyltransferase [Bifidobacterium dolichotidis]|uniref:Acetyltransferase n=1 Tax=Bifidobacterium dolichotidis TaxID=2306976 RepID=A0A430FSU7_9BIFI|nr:acetyltransferase [Bifidobacterium dolichotidis]
MSITVVEPLQSKYLADFKRDMQDAFRKGVEAAFGESGSEILNEAEIDEALNREHSAAFAAMQGSELVGGAIVDVNPETGHGELTLLYARHDHQSEGIGRTIWQWIEQQYPKVTEWETCTPYFDRRNVHFYINSCGFHAVDLSRDDDLQIEGETPMPEEEAWMFTFIKKMQ